MAQYPSPRYRRVRNLDDPTGDPADAPTKEYVDSTAASLIPASHRGVPNGIAELDNNGQVPPAQLPPAATGGLNYKSQWDPTVNTTPALATGGLYNGGATTKGDYVVVTKTGSSTAIDGLTSWTVGDWAVSTGSKWERQANSTGFGTMAPQNASAVAITGGTAVLAQQSISGGDLTKTLDFTAHDDLPASILIADDLGFVGVQIDPDGTLDVATINADAATGVFLQQQVTLPNTSVYEVSDGVNGIQFQDEFGFVAFILKDNGTVEAQTVSVDTINANQVIVPAAPIVGGSLSLDFFSITELDDGLDDVWFVDEFGYAALGITGVDGTVIGGGGGSGGGSGGGGGSDPTLFDEPTLTARDALASALSMAVRDQTDGKITAPIWKYNHIITYGQSIALGSESTRISIAEGFDNLCFGSRPGNADGTGSVFVPTTDSNFHPLDNATAFPEAPVISIGNQMRRLQLQLRALATDPSRQLVCNGCGLGGQPIEKLSKGASPNLYGQMPSLVTQTKAAAVAAGGSYGVLAIVFMGGEANYYDAGADNTENGYLALWETLKSDLTTDLMAITGQQYPPVFILAQAGSVFDTGALDDAHVGNAQIRSATANESTYLASTYYQTPNQTTSDQHPTADGYRWLGSKCGHVLHKIVDKGEGWAPFYIRTARSRGSQVLLECHTPQPPIQSKPCYVDSTTTVTFDDLGFRAGDDFGAYGVLSVELRSSVILLTLDRAVNTDAHPWVQYGDHTTHQGNGNVCDSDPFLSFDPFTLTGNPYPGWNWLANQRIAVSADT
jgi:hypothetical protein